MPGRLDGKVAIITGTASGIGRAAAPLFADEGARVVGCDTNDAGGRETLAAIEARGRPSVFVRADVSQEPDVERLVAQALDAFGRIDVLYNNAGIGYSTPITLGDVTDIPVENWDAVLAVNLRSVYLCCKHVIPVMARQGGGAIVNTSSAMATGSIPGADAYTAAKAGIVGLTRVMAKRHGPSGIRVNCICPGTILTPMIEEMYRDRQRASKGESVPLRRLGRPEDVAPAALFLASDEASFITGAVLFVDGGAWI